MASENIEPSDFATAVPPLPSPSTAAMLLEAAWLGREPDDGQSARAGRWAVGFAMFSLLL